MANISPPEQHSVDIEADALEARGKARQQWIGHIFKMDRLQYVIDRVEDIGGGIWRLHLIEEVGEL